MSTAKWQDIVGSKKIFISWNIIWLKVKISIAPQHYSRTSLSLHYCTMKQNEMAYALELNIDFYRFNTIMMTDRIRAWISNGFLWISWLPPSGLTNNISLVIAYVAGRFLNKRQKKEVFTFWAATLSYFFYGRSDPTTYQALVTEFFMLKKIKLHVMPNYFKKQCSSSSFLLTSGNKTGSNWPGVLSRLVPCIYSSNQITTNQTGNLKLKFDQIPVLYQ